MTEPTSKTPAGRELDGAMKVYLITCTEWLGPGREAPDSPTKMNPTIRPLAFFSRGQSLADAMLAIMKKQADFNCRHEPNVAVTFHLVSVAELHEDVPDETLYGMGAEVLPNADDARSKALGGLARRDVADGSYDTACTGEE